LNFDSLIRSTRERELLSLPEAVLDEIFERSCKIIMEESPFNYCRSSLETIVNFLVKSKSAKCSSIFEVLASEKEKAILNYRNNNNIMQTVAEGGPPGEGRALKPLLTWKLANLNLR